MREHDLAAPPGARREKRRVGRGWGSGRGKTAGRGQKGQKARDTVPAYFEGGQLPLVRKLPYRRGFTNPFRVEYAIVNVGQLDRLDPGVEVTPDTLKAAGLLRRRGLPVKILAGGRLSRALTVRAHAFSASARAAIEAAGGAAVELGSA